MASIVKLHPKVMMLKLKIWQVECCHYFGEGTYPVALREFSELYD